MSNSITLFKLTIQGIRDITSTINQLDGMTTGIVDVSDLYRAQIVLVISALDHFVHEFVLEEMLEIYNGRRSSSLAFEKFSIPISTVISARPNESIILSHIRQKNSWLSFQDPDKIADAVRHISDKKLWEEVAPKFLLNPKDLKSKLKLIVDRRNKIAHESDLDPSFPGRKWPVSRADVNDIADFIENLVLEIYAKIK